MPETSLAPKVSAVIPTRNRPELVWRAVQGALAQTVHDLEVVVVIDGPDTKTLSMLQQIEDQRLRIIALEKSVGASQARNLGAQQAHGEFVALLDDDDEWLPTKIEKQLAAAESAKGTAILVVCSFLLRSGNADAVVPRRFPRSNEDMSEYLFGSPRNGFQTSGFFCSRELIIRVPWRDLKGLQDIDWFLRVTAEPSVQFVIVPEPLCTYWVEDGSTITSKLDWRTCLTWAQTNRALMTRRAYSCFIAKVCVHRARKENAGFSSIARLLRDFLFEGSPTVSSLIWFVAYSLLAYERRRNLANRLFSLRAKLHLLSLRTRFRQI
jgi:glycosyltransferase involved in cell wall biosynthesis